MRRTHVRLPRGTVIALLLGGAFVLSGCYVRFNPGIPGTAPDCSAYSLDPSDPRDFTFQFPAPVFAGEWFTLTVEARGANGTVDPTYRGYVVFGSSDPRSQPPTAASFFPFHGGQQVVVARFVTPGAHFLAAIDSDDNDRAGVSPCITVVARDGPSPSPAYTFDVPSRASEGVSFDLVLRPAGQNRPLADEHVVFGSDDGMADLPRPITAPLVLAHLTAALHEPGDRVVAAVDAHDNSHAATSAPIRVDAWQTDKWAPAGSAGSVGIAGWWYREVKATDGSRAVELELRFLRYCGVPRPAGDPLLSLRVDMGETRVAQRDVGLATPCSREGPAVRLQVPTGSGDDWRLDLAGNEVYLGSIGGPALPAVAGP